VLHCVCENREELAVEDFHEFAAEQFPVGSCDDHKDEGTSGEKVHTQITSLDGIKLVRGIIREARDDRLQSTRKTGEHIFVPIPAVNRLSTKCESEKVKRVLKPGRVPIVLRVEF
jgi:hypothetical protein